MEFEVQAHDRYGSRHCGEVLGKLGTRLYVSYGTVVGIEAFGRAFFTEKRHSITTSKQRTTTLYRNAGYDRVEVISHGFFMVLCQIAGLKLKETVFHGQRSFDVVSPVEF